MKSPAKNTILFFLLLGFFLFLACLADRFILPHFINNQTGEGFIFPPGSEFPYQTPEFSHTARINSLGFRDREWIIPKNSSATRVLAIGDSFTFGMGVELEHTWPKLLEKQLNENGAAVEIANLGKPGADPAIYAEIAKKTIPVLKPDIIIIAFLQGDDLAQTIRQVRSDKKNTALTGLTFRLHKALHYLYPNSSRIMQKKITGGSSFKSKDRTLETIWKNQALALSEGYSGERKKRFDAMAPTAKDMFLSGHLNPGLVSMAISDPQYFATPLNGNNPDVSDAAKNIQSHLFAIKNNAGNAKVIVLSIPLGAYTSRSVLQAHAEIGFATFPEMLVTTAPDDLLLEICTETGVPLYTVTEPFRQLTTRENLYFTYDGHFNQNGHAVFTNLLFPMLQDHFPKLTQPNEMK